VRENTFKRSEKEEFLDDYFRNQLQELIRKIKTPGQENREDHVEYIHDLLMTIADEYQAVMIDKEDGYWNSIEMWHDELQQRTVLNWVKESVNKTEGTS
jgi:hypothetical protein